MKLLFTILTISVLCFIVGSFAPWWIIAVVPFLVTLFAGVQPGKAFLAGFLGVGAYWKLLVLYRDLPNHHILSTRMAGLFHLPGPWAFLIVTVLIGALVGGLAAWAGSLLKTR